MLWKKTEWKWFFFLYCTLSNSTTTFPRKNINSFAVLPQGWFANMPCTCVSSVRFVNQESEIDTPVLQSVLEATQGWNSSNDMLHLRKDRFTTLSPVPALSKWKIGLCNVWRLMFYDHHLKSMFYFSGVPYFQ